MEETANSTTSAAYIGVRKRKWGKWVSEIREPGKKTRIWLGSFETPEMAAVAHDVAAFWLKGQNARLNFPESVGQYRKPLSSDPNDVRSAALEAALEVKLRQGEDDLEKMLCVSKPAGGLERIGSGPGIGYGGNDWGPDSPKMWRELAEAMLVSPPQLSWPEVNHEVEALEHGSTNLWGLF